MANQNGQKPKLEITELNRPAKFRMLRNEPIKGKQTNGDPWQLYPVKDESGNELSFFAPDDVHSILAEHKLKAGDEFILARVENGKKGSSKLQVSIIGKSEKEDTPAQTDNLKAIMLQCVLDGQAIINEVKDLGFRVDDLRAIILSLFIARSRGGNGFH